jgi:hypothetical protein
VGLEPEQQIRSVLARYGLPPDVVVRPHGGGHINASYRVSGSGPAAKGDFLLQRLNPVVFKDGAAVMRNLARVSAQLERAVALTGLPDCDRRVLRLIPTLRDEPAVLAADGAWWRLLHFIPKTRMLERVEDPRQAREIGAAFGLFHRLVAGYIGPPLEVTIPGFHDTSARLAGFEETLRRNPLNRASLVSGEIRFVREHVALAGLLQPVLKRGPARIVHNDAKPSNVLLAEDTGAGLAVVDLDTVMPGTVLHDVGDLIRSASSVAPEDAADFEQVRAEPSLFLALASGFLSAGGPGVLDAMEREHFVAAGLVITYEQGVRFLTDYLAGDGYYRISRPGQNLDRARVQLRLLASLESMRGDLERTITDLTHSLWS